MLTLTSVTANGNEDDGLDAQGTGTASPSVTITGGTYNSNGDDGIDFSRPYADSTLKIDGATANLNDDKGFDFDGFDDYSFDFDNLVADANGDDGVDIDVNRTNISIDNSFARNNGDDGFEVESSGGEALARITLTNVVASGGEDGVDATNLDRTDLSIDHGSFFNNGESGLNIEGDEPGNRILVTNSCIERNGFPRDSDDTPRGGIFLRDLVSSDVTIGGFVLTTPPSTTAVPDPTPGQTDAGTGNRIAGNSPWGVRIEGSGDLLVDATFNFWGAADGPIPVGSGNSVEEEEEETIHFEPFLIETPVSPCGQSTPPLVLPPLQVTVTVTKAVEGDAPEGASYSFELDCSGADSSFALAAGETFSTTLNAGGSCSLTETDNGGAASVSGEFSGLRILASQSFTVTNTFPVVPEVLGIAISKTLASGDPAAVGETVSFDVAVAFHGEQLVDAELIDVFESDHLAFVSASTGGSAIICDVFANTPDGSHSMVICPLGDASGGFSVQLSFTALAGTTPGRTVNEVSVLNDQDGPGGNAPTTTGPVTADVEIVEVLALAPLGDGPAASASVWLQALLVVIAAGLLIGVRRASARA